MITNKIKNLFQFIEYLHSNINNFNLNIYLIKEIELLEVEKQKVILKKTFKDKLKYDEIQVEIEKKFKILQDNTANLIKEKAKELNVCDFDDTSTKREFHQRRFTRNIQIQTTIHRVQNENSQNIFIIRFFYE